MFSESTDEKKAKTLPSTKNKYFSISPQNNVGTGI